MTKTTLCVSVLALAGMFAVPTVRAAAQKPNDAAKAAAAERKAKKEADLAKYDANKNGKLEADERARLKADEDKAKADRKEKKTKKDKRP